MLAHLQAHPTLIVEVIDYTHRLSGAVEQFKAVARLRDGSNLHLNEVWVAGERKKYAYYQVAPSGAVIQGWDNAPHHPEITTHPHHHHTAEGVSASAVTTLANVLALLAQQIA